MSVAPHIVAVVREAEPLDDQVQCFWLLKLAVGVKDEPLGRNVVDNATTRPFFVFGPNWRRRQTATTKLAGAKRSELAPVVIMAAIGEEVVIGFS
jgi:hypothetical protein